jgi:hypothetical protein
VLQTTFLSDFLRGNLVAILFGLLAINAATLSVVLTKIRELMDKAGKHDAFPKTKNEMLLSIQEQVALIVISLIALMVEKSPIISDKPNITLAIGILLPACLCYSLAVLYDTCKSVFVILEFPNEKQLRTANLCPERRA